jgi:hypothetical protein
MTLEDKKMISIIGVHKSATTSIYDYLMMHTSICGGSRKEIHYYTPLRYGEKIEPFIVYEKQFKNCREAEYLIDASPSYFYGKEKIIHPMKNNHKKNKIILILRDPTDRFISYYKYLKSEFRLDESVSFKEFRDKSFLLKDEKDVNDIYYKAFREGEYYRYLESWLKSYNNDDFKIIFYDDIKDNSLLVIKDICKWLELSDDMYDEAILKVKNKTIKSKNKHIHIIAMKVNKYFEYFFRRHQGIKSYLVNMYYKLNGSSESEMISKEDKDILSKQYKYPNKQLRYILEQYGYDRFPPWLKDFDVA